MALCEHYFLGSLGKDGFASCFGDLMSFNGVLYIVKGCPGSGKSTLMKRIAAEAEKSGSTLEYVHCSSDPASLDGIICRDRMFAMVDGTAPHVLEPEKPWGVHRIVSLYRYSNNSFLYENRAELSDAHRQNRELTLRAGRFAGAASALVADVYRIARSAADIKRINGSFSRLANRLLVRSGERGRVETRFYSAITPEGLVSTAQINAGNYRTVYIVNDNSLAAGAIGLEAFKNSAVSLGYDVKVGYSPLMPNQLIEIVAVPEASVLLILNSFLCHSQAPGAHVINAHRFLAGDTLKQRRTRMSLCKRCAGELIDSAAELMAEAKRIHDRMEGLYSKSCDFEQMQQEIPLILSQLSL